MYSNKITDLWKGVNMDNLLDRFGLYDFLGLLLPGMSFLIFLYYMNFPLIKDGRFPSSQTFMIIMFVLISYILGTLMQELASLLDKKCMKMKIRAREKFLDSKKPFFKNEELKEVIEVSNNILGKNKNNKCFTNSECSKVFSQCKAFLENNEKMEKANKLDALFAMSRDFIVCNICIFICQIITIIYEVRSKSFSWSFSCLAVIAYAILSSLIFFIRANRYSKLRTKYVIRQYIDLKRY